MIDRVTLRKRLLLLDEYCAADVLRLQDACDPVLACCGTSQHRCPLCGDPCLTRVDDCPVHWADQISQRAACEAEIAGILSLRAQLAKAIVNCEALACSVEAKGQAEQLLKFGLARHPRDAASDKG